MLTLFAIIGLILAIAILLPALGSIYPARFLAEQVVRDRLKVYGIDANLFPTRRLADFAIDGAKRDAFLSNRWYRHFIRKSSETIALIVANIATGEPDDFNAEEIKSGVERGMPNIVWEILAEHDPKRFGLDGLEKTQLANSILLKSGRH